MFIIKARYQAAIDIEVKMDEMDLTSAESKATCDEIKAYVREKFGLSSFESCEERVAQNRKAKKRSDR